MKLPDKLPKPPKCEGSLCQKMTEEDWEMYYANRENYDIPMTKEERSKIMMEVVRLTENDEDEKAIALVKKIPIDPYYAFYLKAVGGLLALRNYNLYEAKKAYPDEF